MGGGGGGGKGRPNSQQAHDIVLTSMRRKGVASTSFRRHVSTRFLINQCQIITFLILKSDIMENSRIELKGIVLPISSNQIKVTFTIIITFNSPGRVAQSVGHPTHKSGVLGSIPGLATYFRFSFRFFKKGSCQLLAKVCARSTG